MIMGGGDGFCVVTDDTDNSRSNPWTVDGCDPRPAARGGAPGGSLCGDPRLSDQSYLKKAPSRNTILRKVASREAVCESERPRGASRSCHQQFVRRGFYCKEQIYSHPEVEI